MAAPNQITKIYEVRSLGMDPLLADLDKINAKFAAIKNTVKSLKSEKVGVGSSGEMTEAIKQSSDLAAQTERLAAEIKLKTQLTEQEIVSSRNAAVTHEIVTAAITEQVVAKRVLSAAMQAGAADDKLATDSALTDAEAQRLLSLSQLEVAAAAKVASDAQESFGQKIIETVAKTEVLEQQFVGVSGQILLLKAEAAGLVTQMKALEESYKSGAISEEKYVAAGGSLIEQQAVLKAQMQGLNADLKTQTALDLEAANSMNGYRAKVAELTKERNGLNLATQQGTTRQTELNAEIDRYNVLIKESGDAYLKQKINIGNYPTLTAELKAVKLELEQLVIAGKQNTQEFASLSARAQVLTASMAEVTVATKTAASATSSLGAGASKAFGQIRQLAYILPGLGIAGIFGLLFEGASKAASAIYNFATDADLAAAAAKKLKEDGEALIKFSEDLAGAQAKAVGALDVLYTKSQDASQSLRDRTAATEELQKLYPAYFANLSKEAILAGNAATQYLSLRDALVSKAAAQVYQDKYNDALAKEINLNEQISKIKQQIKDIPNQSNFGTDDKGRINSYTQGDQASDVLAVNLNEKLRDLEAQTLDLSRQRGQYLEEIEARTTAELTVKEKIAKVDKPKVQTLKQQAAAQKDYNEVIAELRNQQVEQDAQANKTIFDNERQTISERLLAYENFESDRKYQAENLRDKEIANARAAVSTEATRFVRLQAAAEKYQATLTQIENEGVAGREQIIRSDIKTRLDAIQQIENDAKIHAAASEEALAQRRGQGLISEKQYRQKLRVLAAEERVYELNGIKQYLEAQVAAYDGSAEGLKTLQEKLAGVNADLAKANAGLVTSLKRDTADMKRLYKELSNAAIDAVGTVVSGFSAASEKRKDAAFDEAKTLRDVEKEKRITQATSAGQKAAIEAEYAEKEKQAERKRNIERQQTAKKQLAIEFALASIKALSTSSNIYEGLIKEAIVVLEYGAKLAVLNAQKFADGGHVLPSGVINARQNIPTQGNGDNVLATVRVGEVILNEQQQRRAGGSAFFRSLGVPGFAGGGAVSYGSSVQPPTFASQLYSPSSRESGLFQQIGTLQATVGRLVDAVAAEAFKPVILNPNFVTAAQAKTAKATNLAVL